MSIIKGEFESAPATLNTKAIRSCRINNQGILLTVGGLDASALTYVNFGSSVTGTVKGSSGVVLAFDVWNTNASPRVVQFHNLTAAPSGGAVPQLAFTIPGTSGKTIGRDFFSQSGIIFTTGITYACSTTIGTYTAGASGDLNINIIYV